MCTNCTALPLTQRLETGAIESPSTSFCTTVSQQELKVTVHIDHFPCLPKLGLFKKYLVREQNSLLKNGQKVEGGGGGGDKEPKVS